MIRLHQMQTYFSKPGNDPSSLNKSSEEEDEEPYSVCGYKISSKLQLGNIKIRNYNIRKTPTRQYLNKNVQLY